MGTLAPSQLYNIHKCVKKCFMYLMRKAQSHKRISFTAINVRYLKGSWSALHTSCLKAWDLVACTGN